MDYQRDVYNSFYKSNSVVPLLAAILVLLWSPLDFYLNEPLKIEFLISRITYAVVFGSTFFFRNKAWYKKIHIPIMSLSVFVCASMIAGFLAFAQTKLPYLVGFTTILMTYELVATAEFKHFLPTIIVTTIVGLYPLYSEHHFTDIEIISSTLFFIALILSCAYGVVVKFKSLIEEEKVKSQIKTQRIKMIKLGDERKKLLKVLCHDLANQVVIFQGRLRKLKKEAKSGPLEENILMDRIDRLLRSVQTQSEMITLIRENEAVNSGKREFQLEPVCLEAAVDSVKEDLEERLVAKNLTLNFEHDEGSCIFHADQKSFTNQILMNLITNAIKFSFEGGKILVKSRCVDHDRLEISVKDFGIGIPTHLQQIIFQQDKKTTRSGTNGETGTGFGMPLVKSYVEKFNGTINIISRDQDSHPDNHGTEIIMNFPVVHSNAILESEPDSEQAA
ncbi:MAG: HAMP domain-containing histidine kinase [Oligoflexia bacterium]|nr:HAMP domain-containing histidine kinase [Oligoflexia bacterium]